jgi:hypothetical protein
MHSIAQYFSEKYPESFNTLEIEGQNFILFRPESAPTARVLMTVGLSDFRMQVHEKHTGEEFNELYFLLPSYWDLSNDNPKFNWVFSWLNRLKKYVVEKNTWFGHGHTMPCGAEMKPLSETMLQNHFFLLRPNLVSADLKPIEIDGKQVHFLSVVPIFGDEMDYKQGKGTKKLEEKMKNAGVSEQLDDFRKTVLKTRWNFFG